MPRRPVALILTLAILLAAALRLYRLDSIPPGFYHDEAYNALDALALNEGKTFPQFHEGWELYQTEAHGERGAWQTQNPLFFEGNFGREPLHTYLIALSFKIFGATPAAARLVPALAGILAVLTSAWAAAQLAPPKNRQKIAALTALALAILFPAIHFSRFGLRAMLFVPVETLCVGFFWRGIQRKSWTDFFFSGLLLGAGLYIYAAARLFPLVFVLFCAWFLWKWGSGRPYFSRFTLTATVALLTTLPLFFFFYRYPYFLFFRSSYVAQHGAGVVAGRPYFTALLNLGRILRGFIWQGETHLRHNLPARPYFDPIQLSLALIGLATLRKWAIPQKLFVILWGLVMLLPSVLSGDAPHFGRLTGFLPVAAFLIATGATALLHHLRQRLNPTPAAAILTALLCASTLITTYDYFVRYQQLPELSADFYQPDRQLGEWLATLPPASDLFLTPTRQQTATILFALGDSRQRLRNYDGTAGAILYGNPATPTYHIIANSDPATRDRLAPLGTQIPVPVDGWTAVKIDPVPFVPQAVLGEQIEMAATVATVGDTVEVTLVWRPLGEISADLTAFVHLLDPAGNLIAQSDHPPSGYPTSDWQPHELIRDTFTLPAPLCAGCQLTTSFYNPLTNQRLADPIPIPIPIP